MGGKAVVIKSIIVMEVLCVLTVLVDMNYIYVKIT